MGRETSWATGTVLAMLVTAVGALVGGCGCGDDDDTTGAYTPPEGEVLEGSDDDPALDAMTQVPAERALPDDVEEGVIMNRLDVYFEADATVGQVNAALEAVEGGIVTMVPGLPTATIAFPRATDRDELGQIVATLLAAEGVAHTEPARVEDAKELPPAPAGGEDERSRIDHLLPARFPAAWNAADLATEGCAARRVQVLVADTFEIGTAAGSDYAAFPAQVPGYTLLTSAGSQTEPHGFDMLTTMAALFDGVSPTGANPFVACLDISAVDVARLTNFQTATTIATSFPAGKFVFNYSQGWKDRCRATPCVDDELHQDNLTAVQRGYASADWKFLSHSRWDDFVATVAAGNERAGAGTGVIEGFGVALYSTMMGVNTTAGSLFTFVTDAALWDPKQAGFTTFKATALQAAALVERIVEFGLDATPPAQNTLIVGSITSTGPGEAIAESAFSDSDAQVFAVGEDVYSLGDDQARGTSFSAPQVAGLVSYLWLLEPDLEAEPSSVTRTAILANADERQATPVIDAYATVLSLDAAELPNASNAPVRLAILDVNDDLVFDQLDLDEILAEYVDANGQPYFPLDRDHGRYDLNGDGWTGGTETERFDLDRVGSTRFGATAYSSSVVQTIEGQATSFDESELTDMQILCYYGYSLLFDDGAGDERRTTLARHCSSRIAYTGADATYVMGSDGTNILMISEQRGVPVWSPDGTRIAFTGEGGKTALDIHVAAADGSGDSVVTVNENISDNDPTWSPDGSEIAYAAYDYSANPAQNEIWVVSGGGGVPTNLSNLPDVPGIGDTRPDWAPDGTQIAFSRTEAGVTSIAVMNRDGTNQRVFAEGHTPSWSPDSTRILYISNAGGYPAIWVMNADGTAPRELSTNEGDTSPSWSPDGTQILFANTIDGEISVMNADGLGALNLTGDPSFDWQPSWAPDGARIAFSSDRAGNFDIWVMSADGAGLPANLTASPDAEGDPVWAPR